MNKEYNLRDSITGNNKLHESASKLKKRVVIVGDSIVKDANGWKLSKSLTNEKISVKSFSGAATKQMST